MAITTTREEHKQYCLRALGQPVVRVNCDDSQLEDRIDEALEFFRLYHFDGIVKNYLKHEVTEDDLANGYIPVGPLVYGVTKAYTFNSTSANHGLFSINFQLRIQDIYNLSSVSMTHYSMAMSHIQLLDDVLVGHKLFRFNRHESRIYLERWDNVIPGRFLLFDVYMVVNPDDHIKVWNDPFLKHYTTALFKRQWAENIKKFGNVQLPGGVVLNGDALYQEAITEIDKLEQEAINKSAPLDFLIG